MCRKWNLVNKITAVLSSIAISMCCMTTLPTNVSVAESQQYYSEDELDAQIREMGMLVNEARIELGLNPVMIVPHLNEAAAVRAKEISVKFDHKRLDGSKFHTLIDDNIVPWFKTAENIAGGSPTAEETFIQWKNSPDHWNAIINPNYTHMGVGLCYDPDATYRWYWEQVFVAVDGEVEGQELPIKYVITPASSGDINGDNAIDSFDLILLSKYIAGEIQYLNDLQLESADLLADGSITSADAVVLRKYLLGEFETLPITMDQFLANR